eukprot:SAG11_NODE_13780_length_640_cov_0.658041_2_plen_151_part_01
MHASDHSHFCSFHSFLIFHVQGAPIVASGLLSLGSLVLPAALLRTALDGLSGHDSIMILEAVTIRGDPVQSEVPMTGKVNAAGICDPPDLLAAINQHRQIFEVVSGPCTLNHAGRCVGRWPGGYLPNEDCEIIPAGYSDPRGSAWPRGFLD